MPGERLRFGQPTFAAPRRRRAAPAAVVATRADLERLAARRTAHTHPPPDDGDPGDPPEAIQESEAP